MAGLGIGLILIGAAVATELFKPAEERTWEGRIAGLLPYDLRRPTLAQFGSACGTLLITMCSCPRFSALDGPLTSDACLSDRFNEGGKGNRFATDRALQLPRRLTAR